MPKVRVTLFREPIEVPEDEIPVLRQQGLLVEDTPASEAPAPAAAPAAAAPKPASRKDPQP